MENLLKCKTYKDLDDEAKILYATHYCSSSVGHFIAYAGDYRLASFHSDKWRNLDSKKGNLRIRISETGMKALQKNIDDGFIDFITGKPYKFALPKMTMESIELLYKVEDISREKRDRMVKTLTEGLLDGDIYQGKGNWILDENGNKFDLEKHGVGGPFFGLTKDGMQRINSLGIIERIFNELFKLR